MERREFIAGAAGASLVGLPASLRSDEAGDSAYFARNRRWTTTPQGGIAWVERGSGPAAIFLHGWPLNGYHWRASLRRLADLRRCIAPDFLGLGHSEAAAGADLSPTAQAKTILALMDALGIATADLVANDSGVAVAQIIAAHDPQRVRTLLLTNGDVHTHSPPPALAPALAAARAGELAGLIERHLTEPGFASSPEGLGRICYSDPASLTAEAMRAYFTPLLASPLKRAQFQSYGVAFEPNPLPALLGRLAEFRAPVSLLWGTADIHFPLEWAYWLDRTLPGSRGVRPVEGANLFFTEEYPDLVEAEARALWMATLQA